jgi:hypothetical protein
MQATELNGNVVFPDFNPALGTLTSVLITLEGDIQGTIGLTNGDNASHTATGTTSVQYSGGALISFTSSFSTGSQTIGAFGSYNSGTLTGTNTGSDTVTSGLGPYIGAGGSWDLLVTTVSGISVLGGGGFIGASQTTDADAIGTVTYTYTPAGTVPEPATLSLIGGALLGLGVLGRKKLFRQ